MPFQVESNVQLSDSKREAEKLLMAKASAYTTVKTTSRVGNLMDEILDEDGHFATPT